MTYAIDHIDRISWHMPRRFTIAGNAGTSEGRLTKT